MYKTKLQRKTGEKQYYNEKHRTLCVQHWHDWSVHKKIWRKKMVVLNKKAMKYWKSRKAAPPFLKWKALWSQANKDRLERERNARKRVKERRQRYKKEKEKERKEYENRDKREQIRG